MATSTLVRWGGLAAVVAAALFIIADLVFLFIVLAQGPLEGLLLRDVLGAVAGVLLSLGLVALYAYESETAGAFGLLGFVVAYVGVVLTLTGVIWATVLASVGWVVFGLASLDAQVYPRAATIALLIGAMLSVITNALIGGGLLVGSTGYVVGSVVVDIIFEAAIGWLGINLFKRRDPEIRERTEVG